MSRRAIDRDDPLAPARGVVNGMGYGLALWLLLGWLVLLAAGTESVYQGCMTDTECEAVAVSFERQP